MCVWGWNVLSLWIHFFLTNIGLDLPKGIGMWDFARKGEDIFWLGYSVKFWGPGACHAVSLTQLARGRPAITTQKICALRTGVSLLPLGPVSLFFSFFSYWGSFFPNWLWSYRVPVNRSLWNLYTPPNPSTSLKFFFFPQTVHLNSAYVLPQPFQREKSSHLQGPTVFMIMLQLTEQHLIEFPQQTSR